MTRGAAVRRARLAGDDRFENLDQRRQRTQRDRGAGRSCAGFCRWLQRLLAQSGAVRAKT